jgi:peptidase YpeB-like protein
MIDTVVGHRYRIMGALAIFVVLLLGCTPPAETPGLEVIEEGSESPDFELPENAKPLAEIVRSLEAEGYNPVVEIELEDDEWEIDAYKDGQRVEVLVDVVSGEILDAEPPESGMLLAEILANLEAQGFDTVLEVNREEDGWEIEAYRNGEAVVVLVDPVSGAVIEEE